MVMVTTSFDTEQLEQDYVHHLWGLIRHDIFRVLAVPVAAYTIKLTLANSWIEFLIGGTQLFIISTLYLYIRLNRPTIENTIEIACVLGATCCSTLDSFGQWHRTYETPVDGCYGVDKSASEVESCVELWSGFCLSIASYSLLYLLGILRVGIVRLHYFRLLCVSEILRTALRCFVLTPIPSGLIPAFFVITLLFSPLMVYSLASALDKNRRAVFLTERDLHQRADSLRNKLDVAKKALLFEAPTDTEKRAVHDAVNSASRQIRKNAIPFQELRLLDRIGSGAFGEVIRAHYTGATVAVKRLMRCNITNKMIMVMLDEATLLQQLQHPNIVQFVGISWDSVANVCIVTEFVERGDLSGVLQDPTLQLTWKDPKLRMASDITCALVFMHSRTPPVLHRDLKPGNVLVTTSFTCKLTDFGTSKSVDEEGASSMTMIGTASYMAPEVVSSSYYTSKVDVFALGMTLLEMHTSQPPGEGLRKNQVLHRLVQGRRPAIPEDMPAPLVALMTACWSQDPNDRPTAREALDALKAIGEELWNVGGVTINDDEDTLSVGNFESPPLLSRIRMDE